MTTWVTGSPGGLALVAMMLVPTLYGGLCLYANNDPYAGLSRVPAAVVVEDSGTTLARGQRLDAGPGVAADLVASRSFQWHLVGRAQATAGVADGRYDFALIVPKTFSADLASSTDPTPRQGHLQVETSDANNYIAHTIASQVVAQVTKSVVQQVSSTSGNQLLLGFSTIHSRTSDGVSGASVLAAGLVKTAGGVADVRTAAGQMVAEQKALTAASARLATGASAAVAGASSLAGASTSLAAGLQTLDVRTADLPASARALADGARAVVGDNAAMADAGARVASAWGSTSRPDHRGRRLGYRPWSGGFHPGPDRHDSCGQPQA